MKKLLPLLISALYLGCKMVGMHSDHELDSCIKQVAFIPVERFTLTPGPKENLAIICMQKGLFSAGVERDRNNYWLWIRSAEGYGKPLQEQIYHMNGNSFVPAAPNIKMAIAGPGLLRGQDEVLEHWYDINFGYGAETRPRTSQPGEMRFSTPMKDTIWVPGPDLAAAKAQQAAMSALIPRILAFYPGVRRYELTLYRSRSEVYLLECWRDTQGDAYFGYRFESPKGMPGRYVPYPKLRFDGTTLHREWWRRLDPWVSVVKWERK